MLILVGIAANAVEMSDNEKALELYARLTGLRPMPESTIYPEVVKRVRAKDYLGAASVITHPQNGVREFYDSILLSFGSTFNRAETGLNDANDLSALIIGNTRDGNSMDTLLTDDIYYYDSDIPLKLADGTTDNPNVWLENSNEHYKFISQNKSLRDSLKRVSRNVLGSPNLVRGDMGAFSGAGKFEGVGIFTTRTWASEFLSAGTNRRAWEYSIRLLYCTQQPGVKDLNVPDSYVGKDVPRVNGGDPSVFHKDCKGCHGMMDAFGRRAFLKHNYFNNKVLQLTTIYDKLNEPNNNPTEAVTSEDWTLFVTPGQNKTFGFTGPYQGMGLRDYARVIATSSGWIRCMAKRVVSQVYLKKPFSLNDLNPTDFQRLDKEAATIDRLAESAIAHRSLKKLFEEAAVEFLKSAPAEGVK